MQRRELSPGQCFQEGPRCRAPFRPPPHCCPRGADRSDGPNGCPPAGVREGERATSGGGPPR
eukprot:1585099-Pyramimonas_sp.AAC.1